MFNLFNTWLKKIPLIHYKRTQDGGTETQLHQNSPSHTQLSHQIAIIMMKMLLGCSASFLLLLLLSCVTEPAESRTLHLDSCSVNVHTHELRNYYAHIRSNAISEDNEIGIKLLDRSLMKNVQDGQTCCFLRLVLRFYVERVFSNYASSEPQQQRCASALANAFVSIRRDIHKCHCQCGEETQRTIDSVHAEFIKLQANRAAQKAVGELDTVLEWLEALGPKTQRN